MLNESIFISITSCFEEKHFSINLELKHKQKQSGGGFLGLSLALDNKVLQYKDNFMSE